MANKGLKRCRSRRYADGGLSLHNCFVTAFARLVAAARTSGGRDAIEWAQLYEWRALVEFQMEWRNADDEAHVAVEMALGRMCAPSKPELALLDRFARLPLAEPRVLMRATFYRCCECPICDALNGLPLHVSDALCLGMGLAWSVCSKRSGLCACVSVLARAASGRTRSNTLTWETM